METEIRNIHQEFAKKTKLAKQQSNLDKALLSLSDADKKAVKLLAGIDDSSGGQLMRLVSIYQAIKQSK